MYIHVFAAWIAIFCICLGGACLGRGADLAPSAGRCRGGGGLPGGCGLHASGPGLRLALGPADVGHLLGLGGAPQFIPAAVLPLRRATGAAERVRRTRRHKPPSAFAGYLSSQKTGRRPSARALRHPTEDSKKGKCHAERTEESRVGKECVSKV